MTPTAEIVRRLEALHLITCAADKVDSRTTETLPRIAAARLEALQAEADRLREDAERYRWLRDEISCDEACRIFPGYHMKGAAWSDAEFDAAIDAARSAPADGGG